MILLLSNIWNSLRVTNSPIFLGVTLSIGVLIPFILKKLNLIKTHSLQLKQLYLRRILVFAIILIFSIFRYSDTKIGFIVTSISIGYLSLITLSTLEATNTKLVLNKHISSHLAARIMQTVVQIGSFFGAMISGFFLDAINFNNLILIICLFDIIVCLFAQYVYNNNDNNNSDSVSKKNNNDKPSQKLKKVLIYYSIFIGLIGFHICAYNTLTPIMFQGVKQLSAEYFGLVSASAGLGAFIAVFVNSSYFRFILPAMLLFVSDFFFASSYNALIVIIASFFIGFSINTIRINARKTIIDETSDELEADRVSAFSAGLYTLAISAGPIFFGLLTSKNVLGIYSAIYLLPMVGCVLIVYALSAYVYKGRSND